VREFGIRANVVHPGIVRTAMVDRLLALEAPGAQRQMAERMNELKAAGAILEPEQAARLFVWLAAACDRSGEFIRIDDPAIRDAVAAFGRQAG
jgi:NAD(P)-dependent dehydrogenase (short-subunit alcohol dehydrogenase family)